MRGLVVILPFVLGVVAGTALTFAHLALGIFGPLKFKAPVSFAALCYTVVVLMFVLSNMALRRMGVR
jgi:hypothetical protein